MAQPAGFMAQDNRTDMGIPVFWTSASSDPPWNFKSGNVWKFQLMFAVTVKLDQFKFKLKFKLDQFMLAVTVKLDQFKFKLKFKLDQFMLVVTVKENVNPEMILEEPKEVVDEPMPRPETPGETETAQAVTDRE